MAGWIKIHREITKHWIFQDAEKFKWWFDMLFLASYEDNKILVGTRIIPLKRGQFIASTAFLVERWKAGKDKIKNFLKLLQIEGMIDRVSANNITIITICNYGSYQDVPDNLPDNLSANHTDNLPDNLPATTKEGKEVKEINITNPARTREEKSSSWDSHAEQNFRSTFIGCAAYIPMAKSTGKTAQEILNLLDVYMATREVKGKGHKDYSEFVNLFKWHIDNNKIKVHEKPQQKKVMTNEDHYEEMRKMGW